MGSIPWHNDWLTVSCNVTLTFDFGFGLDQHVPEGYIYEDLALQVGRWLEYLHRSPASRKNKGNPVPEGYKWPSRLGESQIDSKVWLLVLSDSDHWVITLKILDSFSRQRGHPTETRPQLSDSNIPTENNIWSQVPQGCSIPRHTDWLTDRQS
jgi:hypothetical protein